MPGDRIRIVRVWSGEDARAWGRALSESGVLSARPPGTVRTLKEEGESWVRAARFGASRDVIVKCRALRGFTDRFKSAVCAGRAGRQRRGAAWLIGHGFRAARPLALARVDDVLTRREVLIIEALSGRTLLDHLAAGDLGPRLEHAVAQEAGLLLARLSSQGRFNRDCKPSNLIVTRLDGTGVEIAMIDTVAIRRSVRRRRDLARMLASLVIEAIGTGNEPRNALKAGAIREVARALNPGADRRAIHAASRSLWAEAAAIVRDHGDPAPRVRPTPRPVNPFRTAS